jgi:hypothetical protein
MLLSFRAENVRSFRDEMELSMLATSLAEPAFVREIEWRESGRPLKVLPAAGIFGANASGKSNVLEALDDMKMYVAQSYRRELNSGQHWPFRLDPESADRPSRYEIDLVLDGIRHEYGFVMGRERVVEEWAFRYPRGRPATLFSRTGDEIEPGAAGRAETRGVQKLLRSDSLFLSAAGAANHSLLSPLYDWFRRNLRLAHVRNRRGRQLLSVEMLEDDTSREQLLTLLRAADLGIVGAKKLKLDLKPEVRDRMTRALRLFFGEIGLDDERIEQAVNLDNVNLDDAGFSLVHQGAESSFEFSATSESQGTVVWLGLVGTVVAALADGAVLLADELDTSLHPSLVAEVVRLFQSPETNPRRAQLIFNAHDTTILQDSDGGRLLGRDQAWFTEKVNDGSTRLYPLTEFKPRKGEAVGARYLAGRYGGMPILSRHDFDSLGALIETDP